MWRPRLQGSGLRERAQADCQGGALGGGAAQQRQTRETASTTETKDCSHGKASALHLDSEPSQNEGPCLGRCQRRASRLWSVVPEANRQAQCQGLKARDLYDLSPRDRNDHQAVSSCELPPMSCWEPEWLGSAKGLTNRDQLPWGSICPLLRLGRHPAQPRHSEHYQHTPLPSTTEQLSPNKQLLSPARVWAVNGHGKET